MENAARQPARAPGTDGWRPPGDYFWYLGGIHANSLQISGWRGCPAARPSTRRGADGQSCPPLLAPAGRGHHSQRSITHYALLHPLLKRLPSPRPAIRLGKRLFPLLPCCRLPCSPSGSGGDLSATSPITRPCPERGLADHSPPITWPITCATTAQAPIALDWGLDAPVRYLSAGTVTPIEIFGYASLTEPDEEFPTRLDPFLDNPDNVYLLHAPGQAVFGGRREAFFSLARLHGREPRLEATFAQRDGLALVELWRLR